VFVCVILLTLTQRLSTYVDGNSHDWREASSVVVNTERLLLENQTPGFLTKNLTNTNSFHLQKKQEIKCAYIQKCKQIQYGMYARQLFSLSDFQYAGCRGSVQRFAQCFLENKNSFQIQLYDTWQKWQFRLQSQWSVEWCKTATIDSDDYLRASTRVSCSVSWAAWYSAVSRRSSSASFRQKQQLALQLSQFTCWHPAATQSDVSCEWVSGFV